MRLRMWAVAIGIMLAASPAAQAVGLNKGFAGENFLDTALPGTNSALRPELAGVVLADELQPFSYSGVTGTVQSRVVRENGTGTLDFYWQVDVDPGSTGIPVTSFRLADFGYDYIVDADRRIDSTGTVSPYKARVFNPLIHPSGYINFVFEDPPVGAGESSVLFFLHRRDGLCEDCQIRSGQCAGHLSALQHVCAGCPRAIGNDSGAAGAGRPRQPSPALASGSRFPAA
ncbi:MAG: hypothetical protein U0795_11020 [Pirellulales bacterium]